MRILCNPNPINEKVSICEACGCEFAYTKGDIIIKSWNNGVLGPGFSGYRREYVKCPNCGREHIVNNESSASMEYIASTTEDVSEQFEELFNE